LIAAGCAVQPGVSRVDVSESSAQAAMRIADYEAAAREYLRLAESHQYSTEQQQQFRLEAADALVRANQPAKAVQLADLIKANDLTAPQQIRMRLVQARGWLALRSAERALDVLAAPLPTDIATVTLEEYHQLRAQAYTQQGNHLEAAREHMLRGHSLSDDASRSDNQQQLWNALTQLSAHTLRALRFAPPPDEFSGWLALAEIGKQYQLDRRALQELTEDWRQAYPQHPAHQYIDEILRRSTQLVRQPKQIALLLPLSGRFANAGAAVRDGVMTAYYHAPTEQRITVRIYDTANPALVLPIYEQALREGADFIIGPLSKEGVTALLARDEFPAPTLVLNSVDSHYLPANLYQLSLSPEEEAQQVAEHAWTLGYSHAAVFVPEGEWGERIEYAFSRHWQELGGAVTTLARYDNSKNDFARPLRTLLNLDLSTARHSQLQTVVGQKLHFEPRRREDIDFVFLAAFPRQARLIRPQLKFHHAADLPVLATSHIYSGAITRELDRDMDGIVFGDMPWTLKAATPNQTLRRDAGALRVTDNALQRLIALGSDTYNLLPVLKVLEAYPFERFHGETGSLRLDTQQRLRRQLTWARFVGGVPRIVENGSNTGPP
jgi:outer membrane PBP1 activator LpoA protein